jgi:inosine triphosphate pyrophosphatase
MATRPVVNFITGNANKLGEVKAILEPAIEVQSQKLDLPEIQGTLEEVTIDKCRRAAELVSQKIREITRNLSTQKKYEGV